MSKKTQPALIGAFVLGAITLAITALFFVAGGDLWKKKSRYIMYFDGSVYGLQVGAPVVFRGVNIGLVRQIGIALDSNQQSFFIPVEIELFAQPAVDLYGQSVDINNQMASGEFVTQGLRGQLSMQSLLTGQLYIDLDFHPETPARLRGHGDAGQLREIPTIPTPVQLLKQQLSNIDFETLFRDISALASVLRKTAESDQLQTTLHALNQTMHNMERLSARLEQGSTPLLGDIHTTLAETRSAMQTAQSALKEIAAAASDIRTATADNSLLQHNLQRALKETTRAASAVRQLSETIEQRPETLLRGKGEH